MPQKEAFQAFEDVVNRVNTNIASLSGKDIAVLANIWPLMYKDGGDFRKRLTRFIDNVGQAAQTQGGLVNAKGTLALAQLKPLVERIHRARDVLNDGIAATPLSMTHLFAAGQLGEQNVGSPYDFPWPSMYIDETTRRLYFHFIAMHASFSTTIFRRWAYLDLKTLTWTFLQNRDYNAATMPTYTASQHLNYDKARHTICLPLRKSDDPTDIRPCIIDMMTSNGAERKLVTAYLEGQTPSLHEYQYGATCFTASSDQTKAVYDTQDRSLVLPLSLATFAAGDHQRLYWDKSVPFTVSKATGEAGADPLGIYVGNKKLSTVDAEAPILTRDPDRFWDMFGGGTSQTFTIDPTEADPLKQGGKMNALFTQGYNGINPNQSINSGYYDGTFGTVLTSGLNIFAGAFLVHGEGGTMGNTYTCYAGPGMPPYGSWLVNPSVASGRKAFMRRVSFPGIEFSRRVYNSSNTNSSSWYMRTEKVHYVVEDHRRRVVRSGWMYVPKHSLADAGNQYIHMCMPRGFVLDEVGNMIHYWNKRFNVDAGWNRMEQLTYPL